MHYNKDLPCALCTARSRSSRCRNSVPVTGRETMLSVSPSSESVCCPWVWRCFLGVRGLSSFRSNPSEIFCRVHSYINYRKGTSLYVNNYLSLTPPSASLSLSPSPSVTAGAPRWAFCWVYVAVWTGWLLSLSNTNLSINVCLTARSVIT